LSLISNSNMRLFYILIFSTILFSSCSLAIQRGSRLYKEVLDKKVVYDAIIVPGVPFKNGQWDSVMKARVLWSVYLYQNKLCKNIIYSGSAVYTPFYEAIIMGLYAKQLGVPSEHIFYDTIAQHSTENIYFSYKLAQLNKFKTIAFATDPFQSALLKSFTRKRFSSPIQHIPVQFDIIKQINDKNIQIDSMLAFKNSFVSILEKEKFRARIKGTLGRQIYYGPDKQLRPL
jgi:uncharacterized SAM-binding protein YcdF (DUF218 family)